MLVPNVVCTLHVMSVWKFFLVFLYSYPIFMFVLLFFLVRSFSFCTMTKPSMHENCACGNICQYVLAGCVSALKPKHRNYAQQMYTSTHIHCAFMCSLMKQTNERTNKKMPIAVWRIMNLVNIRLNRRERRNHQIKMQNEASIWINR